MIWALLTLLLLLGILLWLPIELEIDTNRSIYRARWRGLLGFRGVPTESGWQWFFQFLFFEKKWKLQEKKPKPPKKKKRKKKKGLPISPKQMFALAKKLIQTFKVIRFRINWDTGDFVKNAYLYPLFHVLSRGRRQLHINFTGNQELCIHLQTRLVLLAGAFLQVFFQPKIFTS